MPSYTVTYGDDRPSRPSSKFAHPAHGIMGVLGTSGSDPRERGRKRSRSEIEAASRAEYLAKKEHLAKIKGMRDTEKAAEAEKKTSAARAKILARPDVQEQIDAKEGNRLQQEARKVKKVERLTPEQSLAKGQAEKQQREAVAAGPQFSTLRDGPEYKANINRALLAGQVPDDPSFRGTRMEGRGVVGGPGYNRDSPIPPSQQAIRNLMAEQMIPIGFNQRYANVSPGQKLAGKLNDIKIMARREKEEQQPAPVSAPVSPAKPESSTFGPPAPAPHRSTISPNGKPEVEMFDLNSPEGQDSVIRPEGAENDPELRRTIEEALGNPSGRRRNTPVPFNPATGRLDQSVAEENMSPQDRQFVQGQRSKYQTAALPYSAPTGLAEYYGGEGGKQLMSDTLDTAGRAGNYLYNLFGDYKGGPQEESLGTSQANAEIFGPPAPQPEAEIFGPPAPEPEAEVFGPPAPEQKPVGPRDVRRYGRFKVKQRR